MVDTKNISLSPSKVDTFTGCRRLFAYRYIRPPFTPAENKYFLIGNLAHKVLENIYKQHMAAPIKDWSKEMGHHFKEAVKTFKAVEKIKQGVIVQQDLLNIKNMLKNYLNYIKEHGIEKPYMLESLKKITVAGITVWLKADRIDILKDGTYRVVDYKSGKPGTPKSEKESVQIPSYGMLVRQLEKREVTVEGSYLYLAHMDTKKGVHSYQVTDEWMDQATKKYTQVYRELQDGCEFIQNFKYKYCGRMCDFREYCLKDENN